MVKRIQGVVLGRTIEQDEDIGVLDGQRVNVQVRGRAVTDLGTGHHAIGRHRRGCARLRRGVRAGSARSRAGHDPGHR